MTSNAARDAQFNVKQVSASHAQEMTAVEQRGGHFGTSSYEYEEEFTDDLMRLQGFHKKHQNLLRVKNTTQGLEDLVQGLMGLGLKNISYETMGWREQTYRATMELENFTITIQEKGAE
jgi:hypothetical protein